MAAPKSNHLLRLVYQFSIAALYQFTSAADKAEVPTGHSSQIQSLRPLTYALLPLVAHNPNDRSGLGLFDVCPARDEFG